MKKIIITSILTLLITGWNAIGAPDYPDEYLGLPGDNLNLYAVMKLFQESETLEGFERNLNIEDSRINNLDLNGDNMVDYLTVSDYVDGNVHTIVLRAFLNQYESQDVAVFVVEQLRNGEVRIQLIGDEALYGENYIIEPIYSETPNPGYIGRTGNRSGVTVVTTNYYDIAAWPVIRYICHPAYVVWRSSWYWGYYPVYWDPWSPYYWHFYYGYHYNWNTYYHRNYRPWKHVRWNRYDRFYSNRVRVYSPTVVVNINRGVYRDTYSRPDQKRAGEELYARTRDSRRANQAVRPAARSEERPVTGRNTSTMRREATAPVQNRTTSRSNTARTAPTQRATTSRSSSVKVSTGRNSSGSATVNQRKAPVRSSRTAVSNNSNAGRKSSRVSKSVNTARKSTNARTETTTKTRRK